MLELNLIIVLGFGGIGTCYFSSFESILLSLHCNDSLAHRTGMEETVCLSPEDG